MADDAPYIAAYDISSNRERRKVDKILKEFGFRVQKSVFEIRMKKGDRENLLEQFEKLGIKTGNVKLYRLDCQAKHYVAGAAELENFDNDAAYIVS